MKKFVKLLFLTAIILCIACAVKEYIMPVVTLSSVFSENDRYPELHVHADNNVLPWNLVLINKWNKVPITYFPTLYETENGEKIDKRIYPFLEEMFKEAEKAGYEPEISSGYRTRRYQKQLLDEKTDEFLQQGYTQKNAKETALEWVANPGYSEHHTGLAVDIKSETGYNGELYEWLEENCYRYGFILRYPATATEITGITYEPWHFRYVGTEAAEYIHRNAITLEEYIFTAYQSA